MVGSVEWVLLELLVPADTWLRMEVGAVPQAVLLALLLAVIGGLAIGIVAVGHRLLVVIVALPLPLPRRENAAALPELLQPARGRLAPVGGSGPRAPSYR